MENNLAFIKERILYIAKIKGIRLAEFCKSIGQTYGNYKGENIKSAVSSDVLARLLSLYPDVNADFLLRGVGNALSIDKQGAGHSLSITGDNHGTNMIGFNAQEIHAGNDSTASDIVQQELREEITYLRGLILKRDEQLMELIQKLSSHEPQH